MANEIQSIINFLESMNESAVKLEKTVQENDENGIMQAKLAIFNLQKKIKGEIGKLKSLLA